MGCCAHVRSLSSQSAWVHEGTAVRVLCCALCVRLRRGESVEGRHENMRVHVCACVVRAAPQRHARPLRRAAAPPHLSVGCGWRQAKGSERGGGVAVLQQWCWMFICSKWGCALLQLSLRYATTERQACGGRSQGRLFRTHTGKPAPNPAPIHAGGVWTLLQFKHFPACVALCMTPPGDEGARCAGSQGHGEAGGKPMASHVEWCASRVAAAPGRQAT